MRYEELYRYGVSCLADAGIAEAALDARLLLEFVCHTDRNTLLAHGDRTVEPDQQESYKNILKKRADRIPLQHITGVQEFMGLPFLVSDQTLIPRQDTEVLVEEAMRELHDGMDVLDMCTGCGCILLSLLHYSNDCRGLGVDLSPQALAVAQKNASALSVEAAFLQSDLFARLEAGRRFDLLVSNPPYIPTDVIPTLMEEVRAHEPRMALDGKEDGLYFYRRISREAKPYLYRGAWVFLEIGCEQAVSVCDILAQEGYREIEVIRDFGGLDRVVRCMFQE